MISFIESESALVQSNTKHATCSQFSFTCHVWRDWQHMQWNISCNVIIQIECIGPKENPTSLKICVIVIWRCSITYRWFLSIRSEFLMLCLRTNLDCCPHNLNNYRQSLVNIYRFYVLAELSERWWQWQSCLYLLTRVNNSLFSFTRRKRDIFWHESISTDLTKSFPLRKTNCLAIIRATSIANYLIMNAYYYDISTKYL